MGKLQKLAALLPLLVASFFLFSSIDSSLFSQAHEFSCPGHGAKEDSSSSHDHEGAAHKHSASACADACGLNHCHGNPLSPVGISLLHPNHSLDLSAASPTHWVYRNPFLGKPFQPPRA